VNFTAKLTTTSNDNEEVLCYCYCCCVKAIFKSNQIKSNRSF